MIKEHPVLGVGPNTYSINYVKYNPYKDGYGGGYTHNSYLQYTAEMGFLGLITLLWFLVTLFFRSLKNLKKIKDPFYNALLLGILGGILAFLVHSFVDTNFHALQLITMFWFFVGFAIAIQKVTLKEENLS